ncbi:chromosomal replication initiator DnaA [Actibacterium sp.]|uniref:chromosomal replication initiator DnaA n=1 Tax=Actibacterium sp. TaxID=1872125 RepID=UPI003564B799
MAEQLVFDLPQRAAQGREDFFVTPANALAVAQIDNWANWPQRKLVLVGAEGAGKTHLAHVWAAQTGAEIVAHDALATRDIAALAGRGAVVIEDADRIRDPATQEALFHLHNLILAEGGHLLLTARSAPNLWPLTLPDLQSRMQGTATATLDPPDDALLGALLVKLFADRQLQMPPRLLPYLLPRMERSCAAAQALVAELDRRALATGRKISDRLAAEILEPTDD